MEDAELAALFQDLASDRVDLAITDPLLTRLAGMRADGNIMPFPSMTVQKKTLHGCEVAVIVEPADTPPVCFRRRLIELYIMTLNDPIRDHKEIDGPLPALLRTLDEIFYAHIAVALDIT